MGALGTLTIWSNTRLDTSSDWSTGELVDLFLNSPQCRQPGDLADRLQLFLTDQTGPVRGVCCDEAALAILITALADREAASGKDVA
ncbi:hypothetical protein ACFFX1_10655 [Dactylosporangium sucinum]|uniref:Uncharacterized protein n=1 Tax=Dactylosporangium sucinum TaxID=1424081 RepID=A0A917TI32_9ACTN|nr:hypothetical protein [Dactylosporangium sucinum]GGM23222.1 hypothetical protein GCM10007977_025530 [Dactylosporangium sucinum]